LAVPAAPEAASPPAPARTGLSAFLPDWLQIRGQATFIFQYMPAFRAKYDPPPDYPGLPSHWQADFSDSYTLFLGARPISWLELFVDPEMIRGDGINHGAGLAGATNGDVIRNPSVGKSPYLARYFARATIPLGEERTTPEADDHIFALPTPVRRFTLSFGKMGTNDFFDTNAYANSTRTEFMNWAFINNTAYDYAADTRGYSIGGVAELNFEDWAVRVGSFEMPTEANGIKLAKNLGESRGDQIELELRPHVISSAGVGEASGKPTIIRLLAYRNISHAGRYSDALALAEAMGAIPDITAVRKAGTAKYGFGVNIEQPLADDGDTGLFARAGWNNGTTETYAFTEADASWSFGAQISGKKWSRQNDRLGLAVGQNFLSSSHRAYLAAGGQGFQLGDGRLSYEPESIFETYYAARIAPFAEATAGYQLIINPGDNRDRGPVSVVSLRLHLFF
jgi:hypothetical protein